MLNRNTFKNKSLKKIFSEPNLHNFEFKKSYVSGYSILVIESDNSMTSFVYNEDEDARDEDFETLENLLEHEKGKIN